MLDYEITDDQSTRICPYCKHKQRFTDDALGEDEELEEECEECGKEYLVIGQCNYWFNCRKKEVQGG